MHLLLGLGRIHICFYVFRTQGTCLVATNVVLCNLSAGFGGPCRGVGKRGGKEGRKWTEGTGENSPEMNIWLRHRGRVRMERNVGMGMEKKESEEGYDLGAV